jgi:isoleucyl-tRNA synthetase
VRVVATFLDTFTNWYIRRSRDRFWAGEQDAIDTLHTALSVAVAGRGPAVAVGDRTRARRVARRRRERQRAPRRLAVDEVFPYDADAARRMDQVRDVCSTLLSLRKAEGLRVRLPLAKAVVATPDADLLAEHVDILRDELNVKSVELTTDVDAYGSKLQLVLNPKTLGPRLGGRTQEVIRAHKSGDWTVDGDRAVVGGIELEPGEFDFRLESAGDGAVARLKSSDGLVVLDTVVTEELEREGLARDLIRQIQQARRDAGLDVSDRIHLTVTAPVEVVEAFEAHRELVVGETLAIEAVATVGAAPTSVQVARA